MGYSYQGRHVKLCCDICGAVGARKCRCPVNYCQAIACCARPECKLISPRERYNNGVSEAPWFWAERNKVALTYFAVDVGRKKDL